MSDWLHQELFSVTPTGLFLRFALAFLVLTLLVRWVFQLQKNFRDQNARIQAQLQREKAFSNLGHKLSGATTLKDAAKVIAETAQDLFGWDAYALRLFDSNYELDTPILDMDTIAGQRVEVMTPPRQVSQMAKKISAEGPQLILRDNPNSGTLATVPFGDETKRSASLMFVPIRDAARAIGILTIQSYAKNAYDREDLDVLQKLADHCGGAVERIRSQDLLKQAYDEMEERVKDRTRELLQSNSLLHEEIEERKRTETALAHEQHLLNSLMDSGPDYIYFKDTEGRFTRVNIAFANQFGNREPAEMLGTTDFDFLSEGAARESYEDEQRVIRTGEAILNKEEHEVWLNGHEWWCLTSKMPFRDRTGKIVGTFGVTRDITQRKKIEQEIQQSEKLLRTLFENSADAIFVEDLDGTVLDVNRAGCALHGTNREHLIGRQVFDLVPADKRDEVKRDFPKLATGELPEVEGFSYTVDGHAIPVSIRTARIDYGGRPALLLHVRDITRWKQAEESLQKAQEILERRVEERTAELRAEIAERKAAEARSAAFSSLGYWLSQARTQEDAAKIILEAADQLLGWDAAYIHLYTPDYACVVPILIADVIHGQRTMTSENLQNEPLSPRDKKLITHGAELILRDPATLEETAGDGSLCFGDARRKSLSLMYVPIRHGQKVIGALSIQSYSPHSYDNDDLGTLQGLADFCSGTLERIEAEQGMRASEEKFRSAVNYFPYVFVIYDEQRRIQFVNARGIALSGLPESQIVGRKDEEIFPPEVTRNYLPTLIHAIENLTPETTEFTVALPGGKYTAVATYVPLLDEHRKIRQVLGITYDITERKLAEEALRQSEERFAKAFRSSPTPMILSTLREGRYLDVNDAMGELVGYTRDEMIGRTSLQLGVWPSLEERQRMAEEVTRNGSIRDMQFDLHTRAGQVRKTLLSVEMMDFRDEPVILTSIHDMTDRLNLEEQLRQSQKMEAVGQLAAGVAHDFNNILTIVQGHISLLQSVPGLDTNTEESLGQMSMATDRAANLTRQLLAFSRKQVMQARAMDLNDVIGTTSKMLQRLLGENISLHFNYSPHIPAIHADPGMIEQILLNLAVNARDAIAHEGKLVLSTEVIRIDDAYVQQTPEARIGQFVCLTVADSGSGIDPVTMKRIFEPFFTTKEVGKGTGLGLATVYGIVKQHQGWIQVSSEVGVGTTFRIFFPINAKPSKTGTDILPSRKVNGGTETILVVEDEPALRELVRGILQLYGYTVLEAIHGKEALVVWARHKDQIDLLLTDIVMPEGISGLDLSEILRKEEPGLKIIFTSGYSMDLFSNRQKMTEGVNFLPKPYQPKALAKMVRACLDA